MAYKRSFGPHELTILPPCMHLRSKAIYVTGDPDPSDPDEIGSHQYSCWCNKTQHVIGPDQELVDRFQCVTGRDCYRQRL